MNTSSGLRMSTTMVVVARTLAWVTTTPLGLPVDPLLMCIDCERVTRAMACN